MTYRPLPHLLHSPTQPAPHSPTPATVLPPPGPVWYPSVMGTGILANLLALHADRLPAAAPASVFFLILCWVLLFGLTLAFTYRCIAQPSVLLDALTNPAHIPFWGTVSMGILSAGAALATSVPLYFPHLTQWAWNVDAYTWLLGSVIGFASAANYLFSRDESLMLNPHFVTGLAVVAPTVTATVGANLSPHVHPTWGPFVLIASIISLIIAVTLGSIIFIHAYWLTWQHTPLPLGASPSSWIPLGLVGQSAAAAQAGAFNAEAFAQGSVLVAAHSLANVYGWVMAGIATPLALWAAYVTLRGIVWRMPFSPGWWATTFPIGTIALGATMMARGTGHSWLLCLGACATLILVGTVLFSSAGTVAAILKARRG